MTTLYRPVLIEAAEQAEALPTGTVVTSVQGDLPISAVKAYDDEDGDGWMSTLGIYHHDGNLVGWTALVPIEAEEEFQDIDAYEASGHMRRHHLTRYTTPWEAS